MQKFETTPSVVLNNSGNNKWKNVCKTVATLVCSAGARNTLGPKVFLWYTLHVHWDIMEGATDKAPVPYVSSGFVCSPYIFFLIFF